MNQDSVSFSGPRPAFALPVRSFAEDVDVASGDRGRDELLDALLGQAEIRMPLRLPEGATLSFGLEVEFTITKNPNVALDYRPFDEPEEAWLRRSWKERVDYVVAWKKKMYSVAQERPVFLQRMTHVPTSLPDRLTMEPNGVFEMRSPAFGSLFETGRFLRGVLRSYGPAQLQAHVVFPRRPLPGLTGYTIFEADRAMLLNLSDDWKAFQADGREPAGHFVSAFLAPLNVEMIRAVAQGELDLERGHAEPHCPKFLYGPALRLGKTYGDEGLVGIEVRQWDFPTIGQYPLEGRAGLLFQSLVVAAYSLSSSEGLTPFSRFGMAPFIRMESAIERIMAVVRDSECQEKCPGIGNADAWGALFEEMGAAVLSRNGKSYRFDPRMPFLQPFRQWSLHPLLDVLSGPQKAATDVLVGKATREYAVALWNQRGAPASEMLVALRREVARWCHVSQLGEVARSWSSQLTTL